MEVVRAADFPEGDPVHMEGVLLHAPYLLEFTGDPDLRALQIYGRLGSLELGGHPLASPNKLFWAHQEVAPAHGFNAFCKSGMDVQHHPTQQSQQEHHAATLSELHRMIACHLLAGPSIDGRVDIPYSFAGMKISAWLAQKRKCTREP